MKRIGFIAAVGVLLALSAYCAADSTTQPTSQPSKAETFLLVEVKGTIGKDFSAAKLKAAIAEARTAKVAAVVLNMDTPGGSVPDAEAVVNLIIENKDLRFIALVNKALSAGATITLACKEIYVMETATIGAAVSYIPDRRGIPVALPADVAEKFQSAWRAVCRKAADHGGHSSLLAEGMADPGFAITMRTENGKVILERDGKGEVVKARGRILTLTAKEAIACGLARAVVPDVADLGAKLGMRKWGKTASVDVAEEHDRPTVRLPELRTLLSQYRLISKKATNTIWQKATATTAEVQAKEDEIRKKIIGPNVELSGKLIDVTRDNFSKERFVVKIQQTVSSDTIFIRMISANNRWVSAKRGSQVAVTGRIRDIELTRGYDFYQVKGELKQELYVYVSISIAMEELGPREVLRQPRPAREPNSTASAPVDAEAEARKQLNLAENYRSAGLASKALGILRSVIKDFPNTAAAKEAKERIKELESNSKKAGEAS